MRRFSAERAPTSAMSDETNQSLGAPPPPPEELDDDPVPPEELLLLDELLLLELELEEELLELLDELLLELLEDDELLLDDELLEASVTVAGALTTSLPEELPLINTAYTPALALCMLVT